MQHFLKDNLGLQLKRSRYIKVFEFKHAFAVSNISDINFFGDQTWSFPLYLYQVEKTSPKRFSGHTMMLFEPAAGYEIKRSNLSAEVVDRLSKVFKRTPSPEQIFYYIYAVLYSETYRTKYAEFLKIDFPRVPFVKDYKLFKKMSEYGSRLVDLHLLKSPELDSPIARFQGKGDNKVEKLDYDGKLKLLHINKAQHFEGIAPEVWSYQIGGYQVCDKWLKDRKRRVLSLDEIQAYCKIVTSIQKTIEIQKSIDDVYEELEKTTLVGQGAG
jgi:predicted helicase